MLEIEEFFKESQLEAFAFGQKAYHYYGGRKDARAVGYNTKYILGDFEIVATSTDTEDDYDVEREEIQIYYKKRKLFTKIVPREGTYKRFEREIGGPYHMDEYSYHPTYSKRRTEYIVSAMRYMIIYKYVCEKLQEMPKGSYNKLSKDQQEAFDAFYALKKKLEDILLDKNADVNSKDAKYTLFDNNLNGFISSISDLNYKFDIEEIGKYIEKTIEDHQKLVEKQKKLEEERIKKEIESTEKRQKRKEEIKTAISDSIKTVKKFFGAKELTEEEKELKREQKQEKIKRKKALKNYKKKDDPIK